jgi:Domain of unknown function (DUF4440)
MTDGRTHLRAAIVLALGWTICGAAFAESIAETQDSIDVSTARRELIDLEHGWIKASLARDRAWLESFIADEATVTHPTSGTVKNKVREIADTVDPTQAAEEMALSQVSVVVFGSPPTVGIVTGRSSETGGGGHLTDRYRAYQFTDTFMKRGGKWQLIASHSSRVAE